MRYSVEGSATLNRQGIQLSTIRKHTDPATQLICLGLEVLALRVRHGRSRLAPRREWMTDGPPRVGQVSSGTPNDVMRHVHVVMPHRVQQSSRSDVERQPSYVVPHVGDRTL